MNPVDQRDVERARSGDQTAFENLFAAYREQLFRVAYGLLRYREDAEDAVQETFLKAFRSIKSFQGRSSFGTWVTKIVTTVSLDMLARPKVATMPLDNLLVTTEQSPQDAAERLEKSEHVSSVLVRLPKRQRDLLYDQYWRDLDNKAIADELGITDNAVKSGTYRARKRFKREFGEGPW